MVVSEMSFRDLDRKWFLLERKQDIKRMNHLFHLKNKKYPILTYAYIDHEEGISLRILGTLTLQNDQVYLDKEQLDRRLDIIRYDEMTHLDLTPIKEEMISIITYHEQVEEEMDSYYAPYNTLLDTRNHTFLDASRDSIVPDEVRFLILNQNHQKEILKARLESFEPSTEYYYAQLLEEPQNDFDVHKNDRICLKYVDRPNYQGLAFIKKDCQEVS